MNIKRTCYKLYKTDWKHCHITDQKELETMQDYFAGLINSVIEYSYEEYLNEFGYDGEMYVCYEEFCDNEYLDEEYMCNLLGHDNLIMLYKKDVEGGR